MRLYLALESSLELTRYLRSVGSGVIEGRLLRGKTLRDAIKTEREIYELDSTAEQLLSHVTRPIHAYVPSRNQATHVQGLHTHVWGTEVPQGSFIDIGHGICVSAPEFLLLQLSTVMHKVELIKAGMELCGHYSMWRLPPANASELRESLHDESGGATFEILAATSKKRIEAFAARNKGMRGVKKALGAVRYMLDHSASPMETAAALLLSLPRSLGGYGLPAPVLNPEVTVVTPTGREIRYPDLFWEGADLDAEYQSDQNHSGEWSRYRDSRRMVSLVAGRVTVLPLTRAQLMSADDFDSFAHAVRSLLKVHRRPETAEWRCRRADLRTMLLGHAS